MFNAERIKQVEAVNLKRLEDGALFAVSSACVLKLPEGLVHVIGHPQEELDNDIWDVTRHFEVILCQ